MFVNSMLIRRGLPVTLVMAATIMMQPPPADAGGSYFSFSVGLHYPFYGHHHGHHSSGHYAWPYRYYPWGSTVYVAATAPVALSRHGALKLKVSPKKADVYVDGNYVGRAGKFDGYPSYLWLEQGAHTLTFFRDGYETFESRFEVRAGMITDVRLEMAPGVADPPVAQRAPPPPPASRVRPSEPPPIAAPESRSDRPEPLMDLRGEGARVRLSTEPANASIYLDGRFLGTGEEMKRLRGGLLVDPGEHVVDVLHPAYESKRVSFRVGEGEELEVWIDLGREVAEQG